MTAEGWAFIKLLTCGVRGIHLKRCKRCSNCHVASLGLSLFVLFFPLSFLFCDVASLHVSILALFATVPGTPEVFVQQAEGGATVLSWKLTCKNGIIEKYMVTYFDVDDTSEDERLTTPETEKRIEKLRAGKTYEFQVGCFLFDHCAVTVTEPGTDFLNMKGRMSD